MTSNRQKAQAKRSFSLPWDLSEWIDKPQLLTGIVEDIDSLDWSNDKLAAYLETRPNYQPRILLCLLTYAYATAVYAAEDLALLCHQDPNLRPLCASHSPHPREITAFRRENRGLIKWSLVQVFKHSLKSKFPIGESLLPAGLKRYLVTEASARIDIARTMVRATEEA